ncbi:hypothetical protein BU23DRAFT_628298 [Bimuria novae-zelandiae CBS 107.79]|uniref:Uncharacterized protein n=1 Tax=Bimuria novae-zelandiae CBS 107.79 TaxID=1447943 RepID=A0A6A5VLP0_9PLEO|nr:hypothetical protein BU23DRAFT_628298 [Bimuria novae-zelandiae CBS 107.79]
MQLTKHGSHVLLPGRFTLEAWPICFMAADDEVKCAEMLLALMTDTFASTGGFNLTSPDLHPGGLELPEAFWKERVAFRKRMGFTSQNRTDQAESIASAVNGYHQGVPYDLNRPQSTPHEKLARAERALAVIEAALEEVHQKRAALKTRMLDALAECSDPELQATLRAELGLTYGSGLQGLHNKSFFIKTFLPFPVVICVLKI